MSPYRPPRNPLEPWVTIVFGLMFWLTVLIVVPTLAEWVSGSW